MIQAHVETPLIPIIEVTYNGKSYWDIVKLKLRRDPTSRTSESLFENCDPEEFLLFVRNFNMTLAESDTLETGAKIQYIRALFHGEVLRHFDSLSDDVWSTESLTVEYIIKGLELYQPPPCKFAIKTKARIVPQNEGTAWYKSKTPCGAFDWIERVFVYAPWVFIVWKNWYNWNERNFVKQYA